LTSFLWRSKIRQTGTHPEGAVGFGRVERYKDQLDTPFEDAALQVWSAKNNELFVNLLHAISLDVGFLFDRVQLKKGAYTPVAHGDLAAEQSALRRLTIEMLSGGRPLKMDVVSVPPAANQAQGQSPSNQPPEI
jgi:hypothetical protein